jgi:hypothetical protein
MNTVINPYLFRHRQTKTAAFNNLCTIVHRMIEEGVYAGEVVQGRTVLGTFRLTCDANSPSPQVNIDLSTFDALFRANVPDLPAPGSYTVSKNGYVVFHASGHHDNLYVRLTKVSKEKGEPAFDSRRLEKGEIVAFRLWQPGSYTITNESGGQKAALTVKSSEDRKYPDLGKQQGVQIRLSDKGFDPAKIEKWPAQALVISIETQAALNLQSTESAPERPTRRKSEKEPAKAVPRKAGKKK